MSIYLSQYRSSPSSDVIATWEEVYKTHTKKLNKMETYREIFEEMECDYSCEIDRQAYRRLKMTEEENEVLHCNTLSLPYNSLA